MRVKRRTNASSLAGSPSKAPRPSGSSSSLMVCPALSSGSVKKTCLSVAWQTSHRVLSSSARGLMASPDPLLLL